MSRSPSFSRIVRTLEIARVCNDTVFMEGAALSGLDAAAGILRAARVK